MMKHTHSAADRLKEFVPVVLAAAAAGLTLTGCTSQITDQDIRYASLAAVRASVDSGQVLVLDPRSEAKFGQGHLPGAVNMSIADVRTEGPQDPRLTGASRIYVYGDGPNNALARAMAKKLMAAGFESVFLYDGGVAEWVRLYELETPAR